MHGGRDADGNHYGAPGFASKWGTPGCPVLPNKIRERFEKLPLPAEFEEIFGSRLKFGSLDREFIRRFAENGLPHRARSAIRRLIYDLTLDDNMTAIPAGVPLLWLEALPVSTRTMNAVRRVFQETGLDGSSVSPVSASQFLNIESIGPMCLIEVACVIESARSAHFKQPATAGQIQASIVYENEMIAERNKNLSIVAHQIHQLSAWAISETDAVTLEDAIAILMEKSPHSEIWNHIGSTVLDDLAGPVLHPYGVLDRWLATLDDRIRRVYFSRTSSFEPQPTLESVGAEMGVTRERVRQIEYKFHQLLAKFLKTAAAKVIVWRAETIRESIGVASPVSLVEPFLAAPPQCNEHRKIILDLAGPYQLSGDWYVLKSAVLADPAPAIVQKSINDGNLDWPAATAKLTEWGLDEKFHANWLAQDRRFEFIDGQLEYVGISIADRLHAELKVIGRPSTIDELMSRTDGDRKTSTARNAINADPRFIRVDRQRWALATWEMAEYKNVVDLVQDILERESGPVLLSEIEDELLAKFNVPNNTTFLTCRTPKFIQHGKYVSIRTANDSPYSLKVESIDREVGVFMLGKHRVSYLAEVSKETLRGSGLRFPISAGAILEVRLNSEAAYTDQFGNQSVLRFADTSTMGPTLGSIRKTAKDLSAEIGDCLCLILDKSDMSMTAILTKASDLSKSWETVSRLTGISSPATPEKLASAMLCEVSELKRRLAHRGDNRVLDCIRDLI